MDKERIEQEFADKVERYNELLKQKRFNEAIVLGNQARLLQPENPTAELMILKAIYARQDDFNRLLRRGGPLEHAGTLEERIESLDQICRLTDAQRRKLELAGRGDIKRLSDCIEALRTELEDAAIDVNVDGRAELAGARETSRRTLQSGLFGDGSLFAKVLRTTLTPRQRSALETSRSESQ